ncbi:hypothetical protein FOI68_17300 [Brevibacillus sp. LEMMJ03]|uniref:hypothetical protein n=1 Tax=Brevibacillus sp. LEMMJ03 TaxID=2595056 RepID=UPI00117CE2BC|nr:hypothetical protein [Brevibacillus sp. LEMMJ03]TRY24404.1 hypothetical protein FOI68_17300 [Brevibacillus sp. LEMMJ03]
MVKKTNRRVIPLSLTLATAVFFTGASSLFAANDQVTRIPDRMKAGTIIEFDKDNKMKIIVEGEPLAKKRAIIKKALSPEEQKQLEEEEKMVQKIREEAKDLPVYNIENPEPQPGMRVIYDGEGYIKEIMYPQDVSTYAYNPLPRGTRKPPGTYTYGNNNNTITITGTTSGSVLGEGRFTNFTDTIGENDNTLKKGDCATKGDIDNPKFGTKLASRNLENDVFAYVYKRDNGALPDAVLDIWKTGVELYGLTWSSTLSFKGRYYYEFSSQ